MTIDIVVPTLSESVLQARIARWLKRAGAAVQVGEAVAELETEKVNFEVGAEVAGTLARIDRREGEDVRPGDVIGAIDETAVAPAAAGPAAVAGHAVTERASGAAAESHPPEAPSERAASSDRERPAAAATPTPPVSQSGKPPLTPIARRLVAEHGIDAAALVGTGPGGRVTKEDVEHYLRQQGAPEAVRAPSHPATQMSPEAPAVPAAVRPEERVRMSLRRLTIARRLLEVREAATLTTFNEVDMGAVMEMRARHKAALEERYGASPGIVAFFVRAAVAALKAFPNINAEIQGDEIVLKHYYDIGIAIGAREGLVVPVVRDADRRSLVEVERAIRDFAARAEQRTLSLDDLRGGTFTITNGGVFGSLMSTPLLNPPQAAILGLHRITERPVAHQGAVVVRPMMYVALTYDHRLVDGREAVQFLARIRALIEDPEQLLLEG